MIGYFHFNLRNLHTFSLGVAPICTPTSSAQGFPFLHTLSPTLVNIPSFTLMETVPYTRTPTTDPFSHNLRSPSASLNSQQVNGSKPSLLHSQLDRENTCLNGNKERAERSQSILRSVNTILRDWSHMIVSTGTRVRACRSHDWQIMVEQGRPLSRQSHLQGQTGSSRNRSPGAPEEIPAQPQGSPEKMSTPDSPGAVPRLSGCTCFCSRGQDYFCSSYTKPPSLNLT